MKVKDNTKFRFEEIGEGTCFKWCEKYFVKTQIDAIEPWKNAVCLEDGHIYGFKGGEYVTIVNAELNID